MTTFKLLALTGAALFLAMFGANASAAIVTYDFTALISGDDQLASDPTATPVDFTDVRLDLTLTGDLPGANHPHTDFVHLDGGKITLGGFTEDVTFAPDVVFAIHPATGFAAFGYLDAGTFTPELSFHSPALDGYDGQGGLGLTPVHAAFRMPITVDAQGQAIELDITDVDRARFAASVPEPAAWALMLVGFGGAGAMMRRRRSAIA